MNYRHSEDRVLFFASGDFAIDTFTMLVETGTNIVGLVTSNDNVKFHKKTIGEMANDYHIPTYTVKNNMPLEEDKFFVDWIKRVDADIFCVISFKKLPNEIIKMARKCAFNIHASLLPMLRGAAPINWAIRMGYTETGLTAFLLNERIDCGDIIGNTVVKISENDKFTTLFAKLSHECVDFTKFILDEVLTKDDFKQRAIRQPSCSRTYEYLAPAKKIGMDYFNCHLHQYSADEVKDMIDSVDDTGFNVSFNFKNESNEVKTVDVKVYDVEVVEDNEYEGFPSVMESDGKTYIKVHLSYDTAILITKLQLVGKKVMDVADFLNGFREFRDENYRIKWIDLTSELINKNQII